MAERLTAGDTAPDFTLPDDQGGEVSPVRPARPQGHRLLLPGRDDARAAPRRRATSATTSTRLHGEGYEVLGISPDKPEKLAKFREKDGLTIRLLSDADKAVMNAYGAFGEKKLYGKTVEGVLRSTVVVDEDGKVSNALYNVKATGHVAKLRRDLGLT